MKIPYQLRIEEKTLEKLKQLKDKNETTVSHEIRQAIKQYLKNENT